jgi:choline kinase
MKAIILAAGRGSRMGDATSDQPKCLTVLCGKPLLDWQLEALRGAGVDTLGLVRGYMREKLAREGVETFDNPRWADTNMVASLTCACAWLSSDVCLVSYSDIVYPASTAKALARAQHEIAISYLVPWRSLWEARFKDPLLDAETFRVDATGRLREIGARALSLEEIQGQYMGLLRVTPRGWRHAEDLLTNLDPAQRDRLDVTSMLRLLLERGHAIGAVPAEHPWYEVDSQSDLKLYQAWAQRDGGLF